MTVLPLASLPNAIASQPDTAALRHKYHAWTGVFMWRLSLAWRVTVTILLVSAGPSAFGVAPVSTTTRNWSIAWLAAAAALVALALWRGSLDFERLHEEVSTTWWCTRVWMTWPHTRFRIRVQMKAPRLVGLHASHLVHPQRQRSCHHWVWPSGATVYLVILSCQLQSGCAHASACRRVQFWRV